MLVPHTQRARAWWYVIAVAVAAVVCAAQIGSAQSDAPTWKTGKRITLSDARPKVGPVARPRGVGGICAQPSQNCQGATQSGQGGGNAVGVNSDVPTGARAADNFSPSITGSITSICWTGFYVDPGLGQTCGTPVPPPNNFTITYYADQSGLPGPIIGGPFFPVPTNAAPTGFNVPTNFGPAVEYEYTATHPAVNVAAGGCYWIEIVNDTGPGGCIWLWETSPDGDGACVHDPDFTYGPDDVRDFDLAWCINLPLGDPNAACPPPGSGGPGPLHLYADPRLQTPFDLGGTGGGAGRSPKIDHLCRVTDNPIGGITEVPSTQPTRTTEPGRSVDPLDRRTAPGSTTGQSGEGGGGSVEPPFEKIPKEDIPEDTPEETPPITPNERGCEPPNMNVPASAATAINFISPLKISSRRGVSIDYGNALDVGLGLGWNFSYATVIHDPGANEYMLLARDSSISVFRSDGGTGWIASPGSEFQFAVISPTCVQATHTSGTVYQFDQGNLNVGLPGDPYLLSTVTDRNGNTVTYNYAGGNLVSIVDPDTRQISLTHYPDGHIQSMTDELARQLQFEYLNGDLTAIVMQNGKRIEYTYSPEHDMLTKTIPTGETYNIVYGPGFTQLLDPHGQNVVAVNNTGWQVDEAQSQLTGELSFAAGIAAITDGNSNGWEYQYDSLGQVTRVIDPDFNEIVVGWDNAVRRISSIEDQNNHLTTYEYDAAGNLTRTVDPESNVSLMTYDPQFNLLTSWQQPDGDLWTYAYDSSGNLTRIVDPIVDLPSDLTTTYAYDSLGRLTLATDRNGTQTTIGYTGTLPTSKITDAGGLNLTRQYAYDAMGRLTSTIDPLGSLTTYEYDFMNNLTHVVQDAAPTGLTIEQTFEYDSNGRMTVAVDPRGTVTTIEYDERDRLFRVTRDAGGLDLATEYAYDGMDNRVAQLDAAGGITTYEYDSLNRMTRVVDPELRQTTFAYDAAGNRTLATDDDGRSVLFGYDALDRLVAETKDPGGLNVTSTYSYASAGCGCGTPGNFARHRVEDPDGRVTYRYFDEHHRVTAVVRKVNDVADNGGDADDAVTRVEYDPIGNVTRVTVENAPDPDQVTEFAYDAIGRQTSMIHDPGGLSLTTTYEYDAISRVTRQVEPNGADTHFGYDALGRRTSIDDNLGPAVVQSYDAAGNLLEAVDGTTNGFTYVYDALSRKTSETDGRGQTTVYAYDALDRLTLRTDREGHDTRYAYDGVGNLTATINPQTDPAPASQYVYDARGSILTLTDFNGGETTYAYDTIGRMTRQTYPDGHDATYGYGGSLKPTTRVDQNGDTTTLAYDALDRLTQRSYTLAPSSPAVATPTETFAYDRAGNLTSADNTGTDLDFAYDAAGRMSSMTQNGNTTTIGHGFTGSGSTRTLGYAGGLTVTETRDVRRRLTGVSDGGGGIATYAYDAAGRLTLKGDPFGGTSTAYALDGNGWITGITHTNGGGDFVDLEYGRDNEGSPTFVRHGHDPNNSELFSYDALDRLMNFERGTLNGANDAIVTPSATAGPLTEQQWDDLDVLGNWRAQTLTASGQTTTQARTVNDDNSYRVVGRRVLTYDNKGQLRIESVCGDGDGDGDIDKDDLVVMVDCLTGPVTTSGLAPECAVMDCDEDEDLDLLDYADFIASATGPNVLIPGARRFTWDIEGRLRSVEVSGGPTVQYEYDAFGRRVRRVQGIFDTHYYYDDRSRVIEERDGTNALVATYTYGNWTDEVLTMDRGGQRLVYHRDAVGSVVALTDNSGTVVERYLYDPYGRPTVTTAGGTPTPGTAVGNTHLFTGRTWDATAQLYYNRSRNYDPNLGRFIQRDIKDYVDGDNLYQYVSSRPGVLVDPWGFSGSGQTCVSISKTPVSLSKDGSIGPVSWSASLEVTIGGKACVRCCPEGTPHACSWVTDQYLDVTLTGSASASGSSYGGSIGPFSFWAGIRISVSASGTASGHFSTDRCNNVEFKGRLCIHATGTLSISGGAGVSVGTWFGTVRLGADLTGSGTVTVDKCLTCTPSGCAWERGKVCLSGSVDINVHAIIISGRWNIWHGRKCWAI